MYIFDTQRNHHTVSHVYFVLDLSRKVTLLPYRYSRRGKHRRKKEPDHGMSHGHHGTGGSGTGTGTGIGVKVSI